MLSSHLAPFDAIIALGSNIGDKVGHIRAAVAALTADGTVRLLARSANYRTAPWGVTDQDWFVNAAIGVQTAVSVRELLDRCQSVERKLGRERTIKWGPRIIDLDILLYRDLVLNDHDLVLPHPQMTKRAFVMAPLADIAPNLLINERRPAEWLATLPHDDIVPMEA